MGIKFNAANNMSSFVSSKASQVGLAYKKLKPFIVHASIPQRKLLIKAKIESIALYGSVLLFKENEHIQKWFENIIMQINKWIINENCFKKRYTKICKAIKVDDPSQIILKNNITHICKLLSEKEVGKSSLTKHIDLYNALPFEWKTLKIPVLKRRLRKMKVSVTIWKTHTLTHVIMTP